MVLPYASDVCLDVPVTAEQQANCPTWDNEELNLLNLNGLASTQNTVFSGLLFQMGKPKFKTFQKFASNSLDSEMETQLASYVADADMFET